MDQPIINRVAQSSIITINLEHFYPEQEIVVFDIKDYLFMEMILKEKDFRLSLKQHDWAQYQGKIVCIYCSADAIIPVWAYMLVSSQLAGTAHDIYQGTLADYMAAYYRSRVGELDIEAYRDKPIVIKGCSNKPVPPAAYMELTSRLIGVAKSIMYGEPCSTVPIYKKPKTNK